MSRPVRRADEPARPGRPPLDTAVVVLLGVALAAVIMAVVLAAISGDTAMIRHTVTALIAAFGACVTAAIRLLLVGRRRR